MVEVLLILKLYNQGIQLSFEQWNASGVADYIEDATSVPDKYVDPAGKHRTMDPPSTMTVKWSESANASEKLERIMIQKWIALYPLGQEAWSEIRRTGFLKYLTCQIRQMTISKRFQIVCHSLTMNI